MHIIGINGSPRKGWNTSTLVRDALDGAESEGATTEMIDLYDFTYSGCRSCFGCKRIGIDDHRCFLKDDLAPVLDKAREADALVLGTPIYFFQPSAGFSAFMERLLFPYITYSRGPASFRGSPLPAAFIYTMNVGRESMEKTMPCFDRFRKYSAKTLLVEPEHYCSMNTWQYPDYDRYEHDIFDNLLEFGGRALLASGNIAFLDMKTGWDVRDIQRKQIPSSFWLALEKPIPYTSEPDTDIDSVLSLGIWLKDNNLYETYEQSYLNTLLSSFMFGLSTRYSPDAMNDFLDKYLETTAEALDVRNHGARYFYDFNAFNDFQKISRGGRSLNLWLEERALRDEDIIFARDKEIADIHRSARFMFGEKAITFFKKVSPNSLIARAQERARKLKRR